MTFVIPDVVLLWVLFVVGYVVAGIVTASVFIYVTDGPKHPNAGQRMFVGFVVVLWPFFAAALLLFGVGFYLSEIAFWLSGR